MSLADDILGVLGEVSVELGSPVFQWNGEDVACVPTSVTVGSVVVVGGFEQPVRLRLFVIPNDWITVDSTLVTIDSTLYTMDSHGLRPVTGKLIAFRSREYRIGSVTNSAENSHLILELIDPNR